MSTIQANILDLHNRRHFPGEVRFENGNILKINELPPGTPVKGYLLPGFVDAHVHIESSMLVPSEFARLAVVHGTVATVSDPHEIANVLGTAGVEFMLENAGRVPFKFHFGAPSCVPATGFETAGAVLDAAAVEALLRRPDIWYLSEMMNFPGVLSGDAECMAKIAAAKRLGKPVDGHAPGLPVKDLHEYFAAGITTDHESSTFDDGLEKIRRGVKILIREGSAAKNFNELIGLMKLWPERIMFCSDDKHPDDLQRGHINELVVRALNHGRAPWDVLRSACVVPVEHYKLPVGLLREGDPADFILVENLDDFRVLKTFINGKLVAENGQSLIESVETETPNKFFATEKTPGDFFLPSGGDQKVRVIVARDGQIVTGSKTASVAGWRRGPKAMGPTGTRRYLQKIAVVNRYNPGAPVALGYISGFNLNCGAIASCVAHDSHNIVAVGTDDAALAVAVNLVIQNRGGISAIGLAHKKSLALPVAGILSNAPGEDVARAYSEIDKFVKEVLGCPLRAPFMTLSFMALPVIPSLKMTDRGLFDVEKFEHLNVFV